jgi:hypothetical protein
MTIPQALQVLPCGKSTLYDLVGQGVITSIRVTSVGSRRGRVLILRRGLDDYIDRLRTSPAARPPVRVDVDSLRARILGRGPKKGKETNIDNESKAS